MKVAWCVGTSDLGTIPAVLADTNGLNPAGRDTRDDHDDRGGGWLGRQNHQRAGGSRERASFRGSDCEPVAC